MPKHTPERNAAKIAGESFYSIGRLCRRGHPSKRYVSTGYCWYCARLDYDRSNAARKEARKKNRPAIKAARDARRAAAPWIGIVGCIRANKARGIECSIDSAWARSVWDGRCSVTGIELVPGVGGTARWNSPSIDRIDSSLGYTPCNCRFVAWFINAMKGAMSEAEFRNAIEIIKRIP